MGFVGRSLGNWAWHQWDQGTTPMDLVRNLGFVGPGNGHNTQAKGTLYPKKDYNNERTLLHRGGFIVDKIFFTFLPGKKTLERKGSVD